MKILFLDIDGVLNNQDAFRKKDLDPIDEDNVIQLNRIIDATDCKIVISSVWRRCNTVGSLRSMLELKHGVRKDSIIDFTPIFNRLAPRGHEIEAWLEKNDRPHFVILDDDNDMLLYQEREHFVQTSFKKGLTKELADKAIEILNKNTNANS